MNHLPEWIKKRSAGCLLHVTSLPSSTGIGNLGKSSYEFIDFLKKSGFSYWQMCPVGPTGFGDSPYQVFSSSAGNPYLIDWHPLIEKNENAQTILNDFISPDKKIISIFPGSRNSETKVLLPILLDFIKLMNERKKIYSFVFHATEENKNFIRF